MVYWYDFVYGPPGFYGKDIAIDIISAIVVLLIGFFSFRNYLLDMKNGKRLLLSSAFIILGASFAIKILTNLLIHDEQLLSQHFILFGNEVTYTMLSAIGFLTHAFLTLFGFYIIYALSSKEKLTMNYIIIPYLLVISTYFARFNYYLFYLTTLIFVAAIARRYFISYSETRYKNTRLLGISFAIIALSQFVFIFTSTGRGLYILAELVQLAGYFSLLYTFVTVLKHAKQKD